MLESVSWHFISDFPSLSSSQLRLLSLHGLEIHTICAFTRKFGLHHIHMSLFGKLILTIAHLNSQTSLSQVIKMTPLPKS